jgi:hypothetical protein
MIRTAVYKILDNVPQRIYKSLSITAIGDFRMKLNHKNLILLIIISIMTYGMPVIALCSSHCVPGNPDIDSPKDASCSISNHSFAQLGIEMSILFILPLVSLLVVISKLRIPTGFLLSLFRPPRLQF